MDAMQVLFTAFDTGISSVWREEDRSWRSEDRRWRTEDVDYREEERRWRAEEGEMRCNEHRWRKEDVDQQHVENARYLWTRFVEKNRRDVEEKSEQLKAISNLAALFAGFGVVTLTQFPVDSTHISAIWIAFYGVLTAITVGMMTVAMVTCTLILGSILKNGKLYVNEEAEEEFMFKCKTFIMNYKEGHAQKPPYPRLTFEAFWSLRCDSHWRRAFQLFAVGVLSFLVSLVPIGWIKFFQSPVTAYLFIAIVGLSIVVWGIVQWYWGTHMTSNITRSEEHGMQPTSLPFDWHLSPGSTHQAHM